MFAWHLYPVRLQFEHLRAGRAEVCRARRAESIGVNVHYRRSRMTEQLETWRGEFGTAYTDRNVADWRTLAPAFVRMLGSLRVRPELTTLAVSVPA